MAGYDVGVVVVGETPYAEGYGDVGGPQWAYDPSDAGSRASRRRWSSGADRAAVDKVCAALPSASCWSSPAGRSSSTDQLRRDRRAGRVLAARHARATGVADVLFGKRPFTGQLPVTWPRTAAQEPINVGDATYDPLFPFGWGLTTGKGEHGDHHDGVSALRQKVQQRVLDPKQGVPPGPAT